MNDEANPSSGSASSTADRAGLIAVNQQLAALSQLYVLCLCGLLLVASSLILFFYRQSSVARVELLGRQQQLAVLRKEFVAKEPLFREFAGRLQSFGSNYKDFQPVLTKHQNLLRQLNPPQAEAVPSSHK